MTEYNCDACGRPAVVHEVEVRNGERVERHRCAEHGDWSGTEVSVSNPGQMFVNGIPCSSVQEAVNRGVLDNLCGTANFARRHGRMPTSVDELLEGMALPDGFVEARITDTAVIAQLRYLDGLIDFCQTHGRLPQTPDEMPPMSTDGA